MRLPAPLRPWGLESLALLSVLSTVVLAQGNNNNNNNDDNADEQNTPTPRTTNTPAAPTRDNNNEDQKTTSSRSTSTRTTNTPDPTPTTAGPLPTLSDGKTSTDSDAPLPTIPGVAGSYSYPAPAVPPTINAPFMDRSTLPNGTVFIAVGAILGAFGLAILVWRAIVACLLHRSVARAAAAQHMANEKSTHLAPPAAFYKSTKREPSPPGRGARRTTRGPVPSGTPSQSNLFFSPTAAGTAAAGANRDSQYLPSGFYAAGSSPAPGSQSALGYSTLRPDSRGQQFSRNTMYEHSPEGSPHYPARQADPSMSSLNLGQPGQRAPSAYLDDLLDENPGMFPPPQMPAQAGSRHSSQGRH
ncbi:related to CSI2 protein [Cephalotrichum gorgonifer]|uniref:Related to CSI2 protein n=1 Tax=Cephalotrichum gorgonifer TaxID=2041049 RepID=A0AAE8MW55_9PEZI|nr:related to CSI2 protein [Cephalotrichum gorgonifer]